MAAANALHDVLKRDGEAAGGGGTDSDSIDDLIDDASEISRQQQQQQQQQQHLGATIANDERREYVGTPVGGAGGGGTYSGSMDGDPPEAGHQEERQQQQQQQHDLEQQEQQQSERVEPHFLLMNYLNEGFKLQHHVTKGVAPIDGVYPSPFPKTDDFGRAEDPRAGPRIDASRALRIEAVSIDAVSPRAHLHLLWLASMLNLTGSLPSLPSFLPPLFPPYQPRFLPSLPQKLTVRGFKNMDAVVAATMCETLYFGTDSRLLNQRVFPDTLGQAGSMKKCTREMKRLGGDDCALIASGSSMIVYIPAIHVGRALI